MHDDIGAAPPAQAGDVPLAILEILAAETAFGRRSARNGARSRGKWPRLFAPATPLRLRIATVAMYVAIPVTMLSAVPFRKIWVMGVNCFWLDMFVCFAIYPAIFFGYAWRFHRRRVLRREPVSNDTYLQDVALRLAAPPAVALAVRQALARVIAVPDAAIRADDTCATCGGASESPLLHEFAVHVSECLTGNLDPMKLGDLLRSDKRRYALGDLVSGTGRALQEMEIDPASLRYLPDGPTGAVGTLSGHGDDPGAASGGRAGDVPPMILEIIAAETSLARKAARNNAHLRGRYPRLFAPRTNRRMDAAGIALFVAMLVTVVCLAPLLKVQVLGVPYPLLALFLCLAVYPGIFLACLLRLGRRRLLRREPVSDDAFLQDMTLRVAAPQAVSLAVRHALARVLVVPDAVIRADETCSAYGGDSEMPLLHEFAVHVSESLSDSVDPMKLGDLLRNNKRRYTLVDLVSGVAEALQKMGTDPDSLRYISNEAAGELGEFAGTHAIGANAPGAASAEWGEA